MAQPITVSMEGTLLNWIKQVGDTVSSGDVVAEIEADKATVEVAAPADGVLLELRAQVGDELKEGSVIATIGAAGETTHQPVPAPARTPAPQTAAPAAPQTVSVQPPQPVPAVIIETNGNLPDGVKASPLARNMAAERGIDLRMVSGTGPGGRITKSDIENFVIPAAPAPRVEAVATVPGAPVRRLPEGPDVEILDVSTLRRRIAAVTVESKQWTPHFYVTTEMDTEALLALRKQLNDSLPEGATKISVNDMIVKAAALTLRQFPNLNSHFYGDKIARHKRINIGIAVALPQGGLLNVVAHNADQTPLGTLAAENKERFARAREGKVKPDDITGATFTVSNLGAYDVEHFVAIINPPEAAILAVGTAKQIPVVKEDGSLSVGSRMKVTISVDHRVSDGAEGALFLQALKTLIETPLRLLV